MEYQGKRRQKLLTGNGTLKIECLFQVQLSMRLLLQIAQSYFYKITRCLSSVFLVPWSNTPAYCGYIHV